MMEDRRIVLQLSKTIGPRWIEEAIQQLDHPGSTIVIRGAPDTFCEGLPLEAAAAGDVDVPAAARALSALLQRLTVEPRPVAAVVEGVARGGGMGMAAVADFVIARPEAAFQLPEVFLGLIPAAVFSVVARRVSGAMARRMALGEPPVTAREAACRGLVDVVTTDPETELESCLERWTRGEAQAIAAVRRLTSRGWPTDEALDTFAELWNSGARTRVQRFVDGHTPWEGPR